MDVLPVTPLDVTRLAGALIAVALSVYAYRRRSEPGGLYLGILEFAVAIWLVSDFLVASAGDVTTGLVWARVVYSAVPVVTLALFLFVLEYTGYDTSVTPRTLGMVTLYPVGVWVLVWTNHVHGLFWTNPQLTPGTYWGIGFDLGPGFYAHFVVAYVLVVVGIGLLGRRLLESQSLYPGQLYIVLAAILLPTVSDLAFQTGATSYELTPVAFVASGALASLAAFRFKLMTVTPLSQDSVVENIRDGLFVLDREDEIVEMNEVAREQFDLDGMSVVGRPACDVFAHHPEFWERFADVTDGDGKIEIHSRTSTGHYHVQVTPLVDFRNELVGRQFLVHDVTASKERERALERQNDRLDQFASVVAHDLRNPLNVASGHLTMARETGGDDHFEAVDRAHSRMEQLIGDVLTLAREGQTISETERVGLSTVARAAWEGVQTEDATLEIATDLELDADAVRLQRLFENLFRNAVEHGSTSPRSQTPEDAVEHAGAGTAVEVGAIEADDTPHVVGFYVADDGPGIPADDREAVFEPSVTTDDDGTGIGLAIVDSIAGAHGWDVSVTDSTDGGARFEFREVDSAAPSTVVAEPTDA